MTDHDDLLARVHSDFPRVRDELERLVRIPGIAFEGFDPKYVEESAEATAAILRDAGCPEVRILGLKGAAPAVFADVPGPEGAPTVLLYAHHDVQPPGADDLWDTPAFEPTE